MFKQRLITTLVLVPLVLCALYLASPWVLAGVVGVCLLALGYEWAFLIPVKQHAAIAVFLLITLLFVWPYHQALASGLWLDLMVWGLVLISVLGFPASQKVWGRPWVVCAAAWVILPVFANSLVSIYQLPQGQNLLVYLLCLVWATDIGAYLVGKKWGHTRLIPNVSPGKTVEGASGGILLAMLVSGIGYFFLQPPCGMRWFLISFVTILMAMLGDLSISMLKRRCCLKDTGSLIPGHGGVLDRLDSLIAALPLFLVLQWACPLSRM